MAAPALPPDAGTRLQAAAQAMGWTLSDTARDQLLAYLAALLQWNRVHNLTALRDPEDALTHHLIDSLSAVAPVQRWLAQSGLGTEPLPPAGPPRARLLDVGSGGGLPGVVLAICLPQLHVSCVDAVAKKAAFIQHVAAQLRLPHLRGVHARVQDLARTEPGGFALITSRAFASLADFASWSAGALQPQGVWLAMKGKPPQEEIDELARRCPEVDVFHVEPLSVPGLEAARCLVWMRHRPPPPAR